MGNIKKKQLKQKAIDGMLWLDNMPIEVVQIYAMRSLGQGVGLSQLEKAINDYPSYFPQEVAYREKWSKVPEELKEKYDKSISYFRKSKEDQSKQEELFGKCPHPDIEGCGIIQRVTTYENRREDFYENDEWNDKWFKYEHKINIDLYNELFNPYGLSKTYDD